MMTSLLFVVLATAVSVCHGIDDWDEFRIIWSDEFDTFDESLWQHEVTASGGGVSYLVHSLFRRQSKLFSSFPVQEAE